MRGRAAWNAVPDLHPVFFFFRGGGGEGRGRGGGGGVEGTYLIYDNVQLAKRTKES